MWCSLGRTPQRHAPLPCSCLFAHQENTGSAQAAEKKSWKKTNKHIFIIKLPLAIYLFPSDVLLGLSWHGLSSGTAVSVQERRGALRRGGLGHHHHHHFLCPSENRRPQSTAEINACLAPKRDCEEAGRVLVTKQGKHLLQTPRRRHAAFAQEDAQKRTTPLPRGFTPAPHLGQGAGSDPTACAALTTRTQQQCWLHKTNPAVKCKLLQEGERCLKELHAEPQKLRCYCWQSAIILFSGQLWDPAACFALLQPQRCLVQAGNSPVPSEEAAPGRVVPGHLWGLRLLPSVTPQPLTRQHSLLQAASPSTDSKLWGKNTTPEMIPDGKSTN